MPSDKCVRRNPKPLNSVSKRQTQRGGSPKCLATGGSGDSAVIKPTPLCEHFHVGHFYLASPVKRQTIRLPRLML
ncbi:hypothetical protein CORAM0001_1510 [Corynebacterium amycolatum SK46]|nr:hypothetical protein CORAM0001_1510 [Corynebacterium amycolatum SK46]